MSPENLRYLVLMKSWFALNEVEKNLVFSWLVGAGGYLEEDEVFYKLLDEIKKVEGVLSL